MMKIARLARELDMSVVIFGVFIAQIVGLVLLGLVLRVLPLPVAGSKGDVRPSTRGYWPERNFPAMRFQAIPAYTTAYRRRRRERFNEPS
jgi:hypothetical protein